MIVYTFGVHYGRVWYYRSNDPYWPLTFTETLGM